MFPVAFVPCAAEEDYGRSSKSNRGQANLVAYILALLQRLQLPEARTADVPEAENRAAAAAQVRLILSRVEIALTLANRTPSRRR